MNDTLFPLDDYTDESAVSLASARRLLAEVEWLDEPDSEDGDVWYARLHRTRTLATSLGAAQVATALTDLSDIWAQTRFGMDRLGVRAVRAARDFLRAKERGS